METFAENGLPQQLNKLIGDNKILEESFQEATSMLLSMRAEDVNWRPLTGLGVQDDEAFTLQNLHDLALKAEFQTTGNPLLFNGLRLRTNNVFGRGVKVITKDGKDVAPRFIDIYEKPINATNLFCQEAYEKNERELFNKGNLFVGYRSSTKTYFQIPFNEITNSASNPDFRQDVWYYQRSYYKYDYIKGQPASEPTVEWYPTLEAFEDSSVIVPTKIGENKVDSDVRIIDLRVNMAVGQVWGVPDVLPAMPYAWAHAEYIRDASKLLKALSTIAWKVVARSKANSANAATKMTAPKKSGNTATMTDGTDLVAMPKSGQVDMTDGQEIAAYVAASLGVSLISLLADPGSASGSYGAAASLDGPTANATRGRQALWASFYRRIYRASGLKDIQVIFPKINEDPVFRAAQTLSLVFASGGLHQDEFRLAALDLLDISSLHDEVPGPNIFTKAAQYSLEAISAEEKQESAQVKGEANYTAPVTTATGQGQSNGVGDLSAGDNSGRDSSVKPGTSTVKTK